MIPESLLIKADALCKYLESNEFLTLSESMDAIKQKFNDLLSEESNPIVRIGMEQMFKFITLIDISKIQNLEIWKSEVQKKCVSYSDHVHATKQNLMENLFHILSKPLQIAVVSSPNNYLLPTLVEFCGKINANLTLCTREICDTQIQKDMFENIYEDPMTFKAELSKFNCLIILPEVMNQSGEIILDSRLKEYIDVSDDKYLQVIHILETFRFDINCSHHSFKDTFFTKNNLLTYHNKNLTYTQVNDSSLIVCELDYFPAFSCCHTMQRLI